MCDFRCSSARFNKTVILYEKEVADGVALLMLAGSVLWCDWPGDPSAEFQGGV